MNNFVNDPDDFSVRGRTPADKMSDTMQSGIRDAKEGVRSAASSASKKVEALRSSAGHTIDSASGRAQTVLDSVGDATQKAKDFAADTQDSIVAYTRKEPVKALLIAATVGALLVALTRVVTTSSSQS